MTARLAAKDDGPVVRIDIPVSGMTCAACQARVQRTLVRQPGVLLMDEPFGALDAQTRREMQELLQSVWAGYSPTLVFITHRAQEGAFQKTLQELRELTAVRAVQSLLRVEGEE